MSVQQNPAKDSVREIIREDGFRTYAVRFDIDKNGNHFYDLGAFANALMFELPEFAYGGLFWEGVTPTNPTAALSEAAKSLYSISEFKKVKDIYDAGGKIEDTVDDDVLRRGEFGELILFFLLKTFNDAFPLISKIYFKDSDGATVHGFDAVHYHEGTKSLWLGESKVYEKGKNGLKSLVKDIKEHIVGDYLKREFTLVGKKFRLAPSIVAEKRNEILDGLNPEKTLETKIRSIYLPLLCTFPCQAYGNFDSESDAFLKAYKEEMRLLKEYFDAQNDHPLKPKLNIVLLLMPVKSKTALITELHKRLFHAQSIIQ